EILSENVVAIDGSDQLYWNGARVSADDLRLQVAAASAMDTQPRLRFAPEALASYDRSARVIALIREEGAQGFSFSGLAAHRDFGL
ncbi:MAG: biopolymer transporter ExbD, partial [Pseudomonadota bacterium]